MARVKEKTFTVTTIGVGQPDYAQPVVVPTESALIIKFPETEIAAKKYDDFAEIDFTASPIEYIVGTNANNSKAGSWATGALAKEIAFYATEDCWIRFNYADAIPHKIPANLLPSIRFFKRVERFYVQQVNSPGKLYAWIEG